MKILVVEDEPTLRDGLVDLLKGAGHGVDVGNDGLMAKKRGLDPEPDLMLLDIMLPKLDGIVRWLCCHRTRAISRVELLEQVWGMRSGTETHTVDVTIANFRRKIDRAPANPKIIVCVGGVGYEKPMTIQLLAASSLLAHRQR